MKKLLFLSLCALIVPIQLLGAPKKGEPNKTSLSVKPFQELMIVGNKMTDVAMYVADDYRVVIYSNAPKKVKAESAGTTLMLNALSVDSTQMVKIEVYAPHYSNISTSFVRMLSNEGELAADTIALSAIETDINLTLHADVVRLVFTDGKSATLAGTCKEADFECHGFNNGEFYSFDASTLSINRLQVSSGVRCDMRLNVTGSVYLAGGTDSKISIIGQPLVLENKLHDSELQMTNKM